MANNSIKIKKINVLEKAFNIVELLSESQEITISEISAILHIPISTVYRILFTLKSLNYVIQNKNNSRYRLGAKLFNLIYKTQNSKNILKIVIPFLHKLSQYTNETINFAVLEEKEVVCLYKIESKEMLRAGLEIGDKIPAHCTSLGKALLAFLPEKEFKIVYDDENERLQTFTNNTIATLPELKNSLEKVRKMGYAIDNEEFKLGVNCIGVPIINNEGRAVASISIAGPKLRFNLDKIEKVKHILLFVSKEISEQISE